MITSTSQRNAGSYEKEELKTIGGRNRERKIVLDQPIEVLMGDWEVCDAVVGWMCLAGARKEWKRKTRVHIKPCGCGQLYGRFGGRGTEKRFTYGSARSVGVGYWASLALKCILATITRELQAPIIRLALCPSPPPPLLLADRAPKIQVLFNFVMQSHLTLPVYGAKVHSRPTFLCKIQGF